MKHFILPFLLLLASYGYAQVGSQNGDKSHRDTVTILSFNDFHGAFIAGQDAPGADYFVSALLKQKRSVPNPVILSGGDNFSGSYFSLMTNGEPHEVFTLAAHPDKLISAIGNHELDWGTEYLMKKSTPHIQYIGANVNRKVRNEAFKDTVPDYCIIERGETRIGIIGLTTPTTPGGGKRPYVDEFQFKADFSASVNSLVGRLRNKEKVNIIVLLMHIGTDMKDGVPVVAPMDEQSEYELRKISGVDAIVSGHSHKLVQGMFAIADGKQVPMIQAGANGSHIGLIQFECSKSSARMIYSSLIPVCVPNAQIKQAVDSISKGRAFNDVYVNVTETLVHDRNKNLHQFTEVGAIVTASYLAQYEQMNESNPTTDIPVIAVHHFKGIRTGLSKGSLTRAQVGNVLPFGGTLAAYRMTGADVKKLFTTGLDTTRSQGFLQTCNMRFKKDKEGKVTGVEWFNKQQKRYVEIVDNTPCIVLCDDFIAFGGDGYQEELFKNKITDFKNQITTDCFVNNLKLLKVVPSNTYQRAEVSDEAPNQSTISGKIKDWENGNSTNGTATME